MDYGLDYGLRSESRSGPSFGLETQIRTDKVAMVVIIYEYNYSPQLWFIHSKIIVVFHCSVCFSCKAFGFTVL